MEYNISSLKWLQRRIGYNLGYVGLGKMGFGMVELLLEKGYEVVAYNMGKKGEKRKKGDATL